MRSPAIIIRDAQKRLVKFCLKEVEMKWECWDLEYDEDEVMMKGTGERGDCMPFYTLTKTFQGDKNFRT
jgi:hypothetical protein